MHSRYFVFQQVHKQINTLWRQTKASVQDPAKSNIALQAKWIIMNLNDAFKRGLLDMHHLARWPCQVINHQPTSILIPSPALTSALSYLMALDLGYRQSQGARKQCKLTEQLSSPLCMSMENICTAHVSVHPVEKSAPTLGVFLTICVSKGTQENCMPFSWVYLLLTLFGCFVAFHFPYSLAFISAIFCHMLTNKILESQCAT